MEIGKKVRTPRFGMVTIDKVFNSRLEAVMEGYTEPTHYHEGGYSVCGKHLDVNSNGWVRFSFGAYPETRQD